MSLTFVQSLKVSAVALFASVSAPLSADILELERTIVAPQYTKSISGRMASFGVLTLVTHHYEDDDYRSSREAMLIDVNTGETVEILNDGPEYVVSGANAGVDLDSTRALFCGRSYERFKETPSARLFDAQSGTLQQRFYHSDPKAHRGDGFGRTCKIKGNTVVITAPSLKSEVEGIKGVVYLYDATTGAQIQRIEPDDPKTRALFGTDVAIYGEMLAISSTGASLKHGYFGYVDLYDLSSGAHLQRFERPENEIPYNSGIFGAQIRMDDTRLVIASTFDTLQTERETGTVWVYTLDDYRLAHQFVAPENIRKNSQFGRSIALWQDLLLVGAADIEIPRSEGQKRKKKVGSAYLFDLGTGVLLQEIPNPAAQSFEYFGSGVTLGQIGAVIVAQEARVTENTKGAVYVYRFSNAP
ncbi:hypothetical protein [Planktotalea sp.]|uniref:hypothetical protein n=1 Tax=Planktotalea sp. TaxID=2029877 RepID=UPI003F6D8C59